MKELTLADSFLKLRPETCKALTRQDKGYGDQTQFDQFTDDFDSQVSKR